MSKSDFDYVYRPKRYLDVIEPKWLEDALSDDEIDIPIELDIPHDDADIDAGESEAARKEESKWTDLDLEAFSVTVIEYCIKNSYMRTIT